MFNIENIYKSWKKKLVLGVFIKKSLDIILPTIAKVFFFLIDTDMRHTYNGF